MSPTPTQQLCAALGCTTRFRPHWKTQLYCSPRCQHRERSRRRRVAHPEKWLEYNRRYREANREKRNDYNRRYHAAKRAAGRVVEG